MDRDRSCSLVDDFYFWDIRYRDRIILYLEDESCRSDCVCFFREEKTLHHEREEKSEDEEIEEFEFIHRRI